MHQLTRTEFLVACAGLGVALVGCGSTSSGDSAGSAPYMLPRFDSQSLLVGQQRVVVILGSQDPGSQTTNGQSPQLLKTGPAKIDAGVYDLTTNKKLLDASATMYADGLPTAYWPFDLKLDKVGSYELRAKIDGQNRTLAFSVLDRSAEHVPYAGDKLPSIVTPTVANGQGVNPVCTNKPQCPFHTVSLADALVAKQRVLFYVGTPAYCQTGVCGPGLQFLIDSQKKIGADIAIIHAEVYTDDTIKTTTAAINSLGLTFEPCLFLVGADGVIIARIDSVFAAADLQNVLTAAGFLAT